MVCPHQVVYEFHLLHTAESRADVFRYLVACFGEGKTAPHPQYRPCHHHTAGTHHRRHSLPRLLPVEHSRFATAITIHIATSQSRHLTIDALPQHLIYDMGCALYEYTWNRSPKLGSKLAPKVDIFHFGYVLINTRNHTCAETFSPQIYPALTHNTEAAESFNSTIAPFAGVLSHMRCMLLKLTIADHAMAFLKGVVFVHNFVNGGSSSVATRSTQW